MKQPSVSDGFKELVKTTTATFTEKLAPCFEDEPYSVAHGYIEDKWGWHLIVEDYPTYNVFHMGDGYDNAVEWIDKFILELKGEEEDE